MISDDHARLLQVLHSGKVDENEARCIIESGLDLNRASAGGATPLYNAVLSGNAALVRLMLERGANPNFLASEPDASIYAETPLDLAQQARFLLDWDTYHSIVRLLLEFGAKDAQGKGEPDDGGTCEQRAREWQRKKHESPSR